MVWAKLEVKNQRLRCGIYQHELAVIIPMTTSAYAQIENRKKPTSGKTAKRIAELLGCSFDELFEIIRKGE